MQQAAFPKKRTNEYTLPLLIAIGAWMRMRSPFKQRPQHQPQEEASQSDTAADLKELAKIGLYFAGTIFCISYLQRGTWEELMVGYIGLLIALAIFWYSLRASTEAPEGAAILVLLLFLDNMLFRFPPAPWEVLLNLGAMAGWLVGISMLLQFKGGLVIRGVKSFLVFMLVYLFLPIGYDVDAVDRACKKNPEVLPSLCETFANIDETEKDLNDMLETFERDVERREAIERKYK